MKIEKVAVKKEGVEEKEKPKGENKVELTIIKNEAKVEEETKQESKEEEKLKEFEKEQIQQETEKDIKKEEPSEEKKDKTEEEPAEKTKEDTENKETTKPEREKEKELTAAALLEKPETTSEKEKVKTATEEADLCSKQAAELKAMFPDLEVIQPLSRLSQIDTFVLREQKSGGALDFSETTVAQLFNNAVKWPKEYAIQVCE